MLTQSLAYIFTAIALQLTLIPRWHEPLQDVVVIQNVTVIDVMAPDATSARQHHQSLMWTGDRIIEVGPAADVLAL